MDKNQKDYQFKQIIFVGSIILLIIFQSNVAAETKSINVIPLPKQIKMREDFFVINPKTQIIATEETKPLGKYFADFLTPATGFKLPINESISRSLKSDSISLTIEKADKSLGDEGYDLDVKPDSIILRANASAGLFYGIQTLRQLLPPEIESKKNVPDVSWKIPCLTIRDIPRFTWRGMHLDVGRHMFSVDFIKKYIDLLALHKMNKFHWHLTEDQGWRIEIKKYPKLTEVGSKRSATPIPSNRRKLDGKPYGGYYSQAEIREVVAYASERFITIIPEIELPGHSVAALASYPKLGCTGGPYEVRRNWGVAHDVYCGGNEEVYSFLEDVLTETMELFPSKIIHIGGDECRKNRWKACAKCQAMIKKQGLKNEHELQSYFIKRMEKFLNSKGRRIIGWDEILEGGLAPNAAVMSWRGTRGGLQAAKMGHDIVMSPTSHCYFDYYQSKDKKSEPPAIGGFLPLERVYQFEPIPEGLGKEKENHILGAQGNVWTEYIPNRKQVEYMAFPRASALAEVVWSPKPERNFDNFMKRLPVLLQRLKVMDVNYRDPAQNGLRGQTPVKSHK